MKLGSYTIKTEKDRQELLLKFSHASLDRPIQVETWYADTRSEGQGKRYWAGLDEHIFQLHAAIEAVSDYTGYTPYEVRRLVAKDLQPEHVGILYALDSKIAHKCLKDVCGVPSSARLGTKEFSKFDLIMEQTITEIVATVKSIANQIIN